jgi:hypothetical protein
MWLGLVLLALTQEPDLDVFDLPIRSTGSWCSMRGSIPARGRAEY